MDFMMTFKALFNGALTATMLVTLSLPALAERLSVKEWGQSFEKSLTKDSKQALQLLDFNRLERQAVPACVDCSVKTKIQKARELFAKGQYDKSLDLYNQVPRGTDYWFEAIEEKGWSFFRKNEIEKALAQTKTLLSPQFSEVVSTEAYFLQALSNLKVCDYKGVFETTQLFKEKQKTRLLAVQELSEEGFSKAFLKFLEKVDRLPLKVSDLDDSMVSMPVLFHKDVTLQKEMLRFKISQKAMDILRQRGSHPTLQAELDQVNRKSFTAMKTRLQQLAKQEADFNHKILQKLSLVEVEAIQRMHADMELDASLFAKSKFKKTSVDELVFMDDGRPWIDELDKYEVIAKKCPDNIRRKM